MRKYLFLLVLSISIFLTGCTKKTIESENEYYSYFDTVINVKVYDTKEYPMNAKLWDEIEEILKHIQVTFKRDAPLSSEEPSELYLLNQSAGSGQAFQCSDDLYEVIKKALTFSEKTEGKFDPTIGALADLWDINNPEESHAAPTPEQINNLLPIVNYKLIEMNDENKTVKLPHKGMIIDLGAIAKGYATDELVEFLKSKGIKHGLLNVGGNIYAYGSRYEKRDDGTYNWGIGVEDPNTKASDIIGSIYVQNKTVVTSGIYERYIIDPFTEKVYHHILDPETGYPVDNELASVSIISENSTTADALSTSIFALGLEKGKQFIEDYPDVEAIFVTRSGEIIKTSGVDSLYHFDQKDK